MAKKRLQSGEAFEAPARRRRSNASLVPPSQSRLEQLEEVLNDILDEIERPDPFTPREQLEVDSICDEILRLRRRRVARVSGQRRGECPHDIVPYNGWVRIEDLAKLARRREEQFVQLTKKRVGTSVIGSISTTRELKEHLASHSKVGLDVHGGALLAYHFGKIAGILDQLDNELSQGSGGNYAAAKLATLIAHCVALGEAASICQHSKLLKLGAKAVRGLSRGGENTAKVADGQVEEIVVRIGQIIKEKNCTATGAARRYMTEFNEGKLKKDQVGWRTLYNIYLMESVFLGLSRCRFPKAIPFTLLDRCQAVLEGKL